MSLLAVPNTPEPIIIGDRKYLMLPATTAQRTRWRRAVAASGGRKHGPLALLGCLSDGIRLLMKDDLPEKRDALLAKVDAQRDRVIDFFERAKVAKESDAESMAAFVEAGRVMNEGDAGLSVITAAVAEGYPAFGQMIADEATFWPVSGLEALRMFCVGWEGLKVGDQDVVCDRGPGGLSEASLIEVPEGDLPVIGQLYENLISVSPQQRKNLLSQQPSSSAGKTSNT